MSDKVIDVKSGACAVCRKKVVSKWCDFITEYNNSIFFFRSRTLFNEANRPGAQYQTCSLPMCESCAKEIDLDIHLCPHHHNLFAQSELPDEYQRERQGREQIKIEKEIFYNGE